MYQSKHLTCKDCGNEFEFGARDQAFYAERGFENEPQRCKDCRTARKAHRESGMGASPMAIGGARAHHEAVCAQCGTTTTLPFKPRGDRPVYCRPCFAAAGAVRV